MDENKTAPAWERPEQERRAMEQMAAKLEERLNVDFPRGEMESPIVMVDGKQVLTADFVFTQMQAQICRIDRAKSIAMAASVIAVGSIVISVATLLCR